MKIRMDRRCFLQLAAALTAAGALAGCGGNNTKQRTADSADSAAEAENAVSGSSAASSEAASSEAAGQAEEAPQENGEIAGDEIYETYMEGDTSSGYATAWKGNTRIEMSVIFDDAEEVPYYVEELASAYGASAAGVHDHAWDSEVDFYIQLSNPVIRGEVIGSGDDGIRIWVPAGTTATCSMHIWSEDGASFDLDSPSFELTSDNLVNYTQDGAVSVEFE